MAIRLIDQTETRLFEIVRTIRELCFGRSLAIGQCTLTANAATTTVTAPNCGEQSEVFLSPRTANAAAELGAGTAYISSVTPGAFVIAHANNAQTDRTFGFATLG